MRDACDKLLEYRKSYLLFFKLIVIFWSLEREYVFEQYLLTIYNFIDFTLKRPRQLLEILSFCEISYVIKNIQSVLDTIAWVFLSTGRIIWKDRTFSLLALPKQMSFLTISYENILFKTQHYNSELLACDSCI